MTFFGLLLAAAIANVVTQAVLYTRLKASAVYDYASLDLASTLSFAFQILFHVSSTLLSLFLCCTSGLGFILLLRSGKVTKSDLVGIAKFLLISLICFVVTCFRFVMKIVRAMQYIPEWFEIGIVNLLGQVLIDAALLYFVFASTYSTYASTRSTVDSVELPSHQPLLQGDGKESVPLAYEI